MLKPQCHRRATPGTDRREYIMSGAVKMIARGLLAAALFSAPLLAGCDASRPELEATRGKLAVMTAERDGLQKQLETARTELAAARKAAQAAALDHGAPVKYDVYSGHFESKQSGLKGDASF